jgi:hypothetical protein
MTKAISIPVANDPVDDGADDARRFESAISRVLKVSKDELAKREAAYKKTRRKEDPSSPRQIVGRSLAMATPVHIQCINKSDRPNSHERILNVGGISSDGRRWRRSQQQAITDIENGTLSLRADRFAQNSSPGGWLTPNWNKPPITDASKKPPPRRSLAGT